MSDSFRSYGLWPPGSSLHRILQARILEGVADPPPGVFPTQLSNPSLLHCRRILYCWATRAAPRLTLVTCSCCCSAAQSCWTLCNPMDCSTSGFPVLHCLPEFAQTHVHWVSDAIQPSHPLLSPSPPALNLSHHQGLFQWVGSTHQVAKVLEFQLQHQSFQWIFRVDFL